MRKLLAASALALLAPAGVAFAATGASAAARPHASTTTTTTPPIQGASNRPLFLYVDTVEGAGGTPAPAAGCAMTNLFVQGQVVVFRMWGVDVRTGGTPLTEANVATAWVSVPGLTKIPLAYASHGTASYWTAAWNTKGYSPGVVDFHVTVVTKAVHKTATSPAIPKLSTVFSQRGLPAVSRLTIT